MMERGRFWGVLLFVCVCVEAMSHTGVAQEPSEGLREPVPDSADEPATESAQDPTPPVDVTQPASKNPLIKKGIGLHDELRFEEALQTFSAALVRANNSEADRRTIYRYLAFTYHALSRDEEAEGAYRSLLASDPSFVPTGVSPRVKSFFEGVTQRWEQEGRPGTPPPAPVSIVHRSPAQAKKGADVELRSFLKDPARRVTQLILAYRQGTKEVFKRVTATRDAEGFSATIPGQDVRPPLVEYYLEGLSEAGLPLASRGDVEAPLRIAVPAAKQGGIATKWWFWTIIGTVVVAGAITAVVLATRSPSQGTLVVNPF